MHSVQFCQVLSLTSTGQFIVRTKIRKGVDAAAHSSRIQTKSSTFWTVAVVTVCSYVYFLAAPLLSETEQVATYSELGSIYIYKTISFNFQTFFRNCEKSSPSRNPPATVISPLHFQTNQNFGGKILLLMQFHCSSCFQTVLYSFTAVSLATLSYRFS